MSVVAQRVPSGDDSRRFGIALLAAAVIEASLIAAIALHRGQAHPPASVRARVNVHLVTLPPVVATAPAPVPKPRPKPAPHSEPRKALPRPLPRPPKRQPASPPLPIPASAPVVPTLPAPVAAPAPVAPAMQARAVDRYAARIRTIIQTNIRLPDIVRALHLAGRANVVFRLRPDGSVLWARLARSSGAAPIDAAAVAEVHVLEYPPFTRRMPKHPLTFTVVVHMVAR